ncbi:hypothetical protein ACPPVO_56480 [Dactylosporangium sp. McL0621]|uniref:hypothetical protein n=1 Tax=Dactylosporangium sp. McL0621 TaxID=3415678 RepID=UPI003CF7650F
MPVGLAHHARREAAEGAADERGQAVPAGGAGEEEVPPGAIGREVARGRHRERDRRAGREGQRGEEHAEPHERGVAEDVDAVGGVQRSGHELEVAAIGPGGIREEPLVERLVIGVQTERAARRIRQESLGDEGRGEHHEETSDGIANPWTTNAQWLRGRCCMVNRSSARLVGLWGDGHPVDSNGQPVVGVGSSSDGLP